MNYSATKLPEHLKGKQYFFLTLKHKIVKNSRQAFFSVL